MEKFFLVIALITQSLMWPFFRFFFVFLGRANIKGLENLNLIDKNKGVIFASNHTSELDPFIVPSSLPFFSHFSPIFYATKGKEFYDESGFRQIFYGGLLFKIIGGQPVIAGLKDYNKSLKNHIELLRRGYSMFVFPEGGISKDGNISEAHGGVSYLSEATKCSIVPVSISGLYKKNLKSFLKRDVSLCINFGVPISAHELWSVTDVNNIESSNVYKIRAKYIMDRIRHLQNSC